LFLERLQVVSSLTIVIFDALSLRVYTVSQKRDPDIIDCNFGKD